MKFKVIGSVTGIILIAYISVASITPDDAVAPETQDTVPRTLDKKSVPAIIDVSRGQLLYENHCISCHDSRVHIRNKAKAGDYLKIIYFVTIRSNELNLGWGEEEIRNVTDFLNDKYYKYTSR